MRILHVYRTFFPDTQGGLEETIRQICLNTRGLGVEPSVFSVSKHPVPQEVSHDGIPVYRCREAFEVASCSVSLTAFGAFRRMAERSDVIHYHFPWPFADVLHLLGRVRRPSLVTYHSDIVRQRALGRLYTPLMNRFLGAVDRIVCTSPNYFATSQVLTRFEDKVSVIPIGLNESSYDQPNPDAVHAVSQEHGHDFFLFVGVLRYYKGLNILLDAIANAPYHVIIAGSGPTEAELKAQARRQRINNVTFTGHVSNAKKAALFDLCRGVVFPSYLRSEAFGVTLLEGAMHGKPLISTEVGSGTSHVNINGVTGIVVPPGSPRGLRKALDDLWDHPESADAMGRRARQRYEELFTGELMGQRYYDLYQVLAASPDSQKQPSSPEGAGSEAAPSSRVGRQA